MRLQQEHDFKALGILLIYVSASEDGMKIVFKTDPNYPHNLICQQWQMAERLGVLQWVDDQCKDSTRLSFLTTPDDVLYSMRKNCSTAKCIIMEDIIRTDYDCSRATAIDSCLRVTQRPQTPSG
jgi:hypothetical protein